MVTARNSNLLGKITVVVVICCLVMGSFVINTALALDGSGTEQDPWRIKSLADFDDFAADANYWAGFTRLETDVNLAGRVYERAVIAPDVNSDEGWFQGIKFTGVFDGNGYKIMNLTINDGGIGYWCLGLFGFIDDGEVKNLGLEDGYVSGDMELVGGLVATGVGSLTNCYVTGSVSGYYFVGGMLGLWTGNVENCSFTGSVTGYIVGGLLSAGGPGFISNSYSTGDVNGVLLVGGLMGSNASFIISNCYSTSDVKGADYVGGLVGDNSGDGFIMQPVYIYNSYSTGSVHGTSNVGGLVGKNGGAFTHSGYIINSYSTGSVHGTSGVGGLVGIDSSGSFHEDIIASFWDVETSGQTTSNGGVGLPTTEMQMQSTFADWDFINVWDIGENQTYPYLRVYLAGDINKDGIVNFLDLSITANQWMEGVE